MLFLVFAAFTFEARPAQPAERPAMSAEATLASVRKAYSSSPSVSCNFVQTYAPAGFTETAPETGHLVLQPPDKVRFDYDGPEGKVFTFDGAAGRQYVAADKQMVVKRLGPGDRERLPVVFLESADALLARYDASEKAGENGLVEVTLSPKKPGGPVRSLTLLVLPATGEVKRLVLLDGASNRTSFTFTQKQAGRRRPDADFTLVPPAGTKVLTE